MTNPIKWKDMTPEQKGALLLAHHEGKVIEDHSTSGWWHCSAVHHQWLPDVAYRVLPEPVLEVERVTIVNADGVVIGVGTVTTRNGKSYCDSIKMENTND